MLKSNDILFVKLHAYCRFLGDIRHPCIPHIVGYMYLKGRTWAPTWPFWRRTKSVCDHGLVLQGGASLDKSDEKFTFFSWFCLNCRIFHAKSLCLEKKSKKMYENLEVELNKYLVILVCFNMKTLLSQHTYRVLRLKLVFMCNVFKLSQTIDHGLFIPFWDAVIMITYEKKINYKSRPEIPRISFNTERRTRKNSFLDEYKITVSQNKIFFLSME